jgi:hypothetical protein
MFAHGWLAVAAVLVSLLAFSWPAWRRRRNAVRLAQARKVFHQRREWLEAHFMTLASRSGKPQGLSWASCEFDDDFALARDRHTRQLRALVGVTICFEAVEAGVAETGRARGNSCAATAVFHYDGRDWRTDGRAVFNLSPAQTIKHFRHELETVD